MSNKIKNKAIIVDASGTELTREEEQLFKSEKPAGFILFQRNCVSRAQVKELVLSMRACVGADVPVLIDQEGGSVARLKSPEWREFPSAKTFGDMAEKSLANAIRAAEENAFQMGSDLFEMGITVNCAPVLDVPSPDCHVFLSGSRTYGANPDIIGKLGEAVCQGLLAGGVTPVIKHIPGHGRARVDSHLSLPTVETGPKEMVETDFKPFKYLSKSDMKTALWAMGAHVVYSNIDPDSAATTSLAITEKIVRGEIGFEGVLIADDISMKALGGALKDRVERTLAAGMDLTMLCNASFDDRVAALAAAPFVSDTAAARIEAAEDERIKRINGKRHDDRSRSAHV